MIFGDTVIVKDKDGYSTDEYLSNEMSCPKFSRKMAIIRMSSNEVNAITTYEVAKRDSFKTPEKGDFAYYASLFEKAKATTRIITLQIDSDSLSENILCISNVGSNLLSVKPSSIEVTIREIDDKDSHDIFGGNFYFLDKRDKNPSLFIKKDDSLSIIIYLNKFNFSKIFDEVRGGCKSASIVLHFMAYSDGMDWLGKNAYLINPDNESSENFVMLTSISLSQSSLNEDTNNNNHLDDDEEINLEEPLEDKKEVMLSEMLTSLNALSNAVKGGFYILCAIVLFLVFFAVR
ncbi:hypothetical protein NBG77_14670 [Proteus terrae]|uniref:hypothetical protein n=1 Tax=Proteus terrae TaxID=1574161 RepID=UPI0021BAFB22|nr:hypothetical protein [Proteus terrae]MCT8264710.1 hypothetical protein [Proteus terrae]